MIVLTTDGKELRRPIGADFAGIRFKSVTLTPEDIRNACNMSDEHLATIVKRWITRLPPPPPAVPVKVEPPKQPDLELLEEFTEPFIPKGFTLIGYRVPSHGDLIAFPRRDGSWGVITASLQDVANSAKCLIVERDRWRGEIGEEYEYVAPTGVVSRREDLNEPKDEQLWESGNYYRVGEAQAVADQIAEVHKNAKRG